MKDQFFNRSGAHRQALGICLAAVGLLIVAYTAPSIRLFAYRPADHASVHLLQELFSIVVAAMVASMSWYALGRSLGNLSSNLLAGFTIVAGLDMFHAMSYELMPSLLGDASTAKAIFFWLGGRSVELVTVLLFAANIRLPERRSLVLGSALAFLAFYFYLGTFHLDWFPTLFVPGVGVTPLKAKLEYALFFGNLLAAGLVFRQYRRTQDVRLLWISASSFITGLGELAFTNYVATSDFLNVIGHLYKIAAYALIYRAVFVASVEAPYNELEQSSRLILQQQGEFNSLLRNVPVEIARLHAQLRFRYVNPAFARRLGRAEQNLINSPWPVSVPSDWPRKIEKQLALALAGKRVEFDFTVGSSTDEVWTASAVAVPERDHLGNIEGVLAIFTDTTDRERARQELAQSLHEIAGLKAALDAHAVVAVTDAKGVIIEANDKFCAISKYRRSELIGNTHQIMSSGRHPASFYKEMWQTVSSGEVWNGEICNRAKDGSLYWLYTTIVPVMGDDGLPERYITIRADITERMKAEQEAQHMAFYDPLTGLPNRRLMIDRLRLAQATVSRGAEYGALILLDLDNFKEINDTLGHIQGDELLRQVGVRLGNCVRAVDTVARMGGDEFVLICAGLGGNLGEASGQALGMAEKIRKALGASYHLNGFKVDTSGSLGVVLFSDSSEREDELLKRADMALYRAKAQGRNQVCLFDPSLQDSIIARAKLLADLKQALPQGEFYLLYQPIVDTSASIVGYEALIRWNHPERGIVSPAEFIPLAEQTGLILPIGQWVLEEACRQLKSWSEMPTFADRTVAVNVSARQFREPDFEAKVASALAASGAPAHLLRIELTESMFHADLNETMRKMRTLQAIGVRFSLDDFGTGYSSLSYLKQLPLAQLKIDRAFVRDILQNPHDAAIARTILTLAKALELKVVAEGIENREQFDFLREQGCDKFQGYFFGKPQHLDSTMPAARIPAAA